MKYNLYNIIKAISRYIYFTHPKSKLINPNQVSNDGGAEFEDVVCQYIDAMKIANRIRNRHKRAVLIYKALDYCDFEIALNLGISERTVRRYTGQIKDILRNMS